MQNISSGTSVKGEKVVQKKKGGKKKSWKKEKLVYEHPEAINHETSREPREESWSAFEEGRQASSVGAALASFLAY